MYCTTNDHRWRRQAGLTLASLILLQAVATPVYATVSQTPAIFTTPPDTNVMFTLDDSGSMSSDAIPDYLPKEPGMLANDDANSTYSSAADRNKLPALWKKDSAYYSFTWYDDSKAYANGKNYAAVFLRSTATNPLYYNPAIRYRPWPSATNDTTTFQADAAPAKVNIHPSDPTNSGYTVNLTQSVTDGSGTFWPATYWVYSGSAKLPKAPGSLTDITGFKKVQITSDATKTFTRYADRDDCSATACTQAQELQNFANWLQYYRSRMLMAKGGIAAAFAKQGNNLRVGLARINLSGTLMQGVQKFENTALVKRRENFYKAFFPIAAGGGTASRQALDDVGKYFMSGSTTLVNADGSKGSYPWTKDWTKSTPGTGDECRRSFHIFSTDGFWKDAEATGNAKLDNDLFSGSTPARPDGTKYTYSNNAGSTPDPLTNRFGIDPFKDGLANTLSDVAAYYWKIDLGPTSLTNSVPSSLRDPAFWQHVTTYTVGLGITGTGNVTALGSTTVPDDPKYPELKDYKGHPWLQDQYVRDWLITKKIAVGWPTAIANESPETGDDLIHASMVGRGKYFSATDPKTLSTGLAAALAEAADNPGSLANVISQSSSVSAGSQIFQATYNPNQWYGRLYSFGQNADGSVTTTPSGAVWEASNKMDAPDKRNIFTWNGTGGSSFLWSQLTSSQQTALGNKSTVLDFLRGSDALELAKGGTYRDRNRYTVGSVTGGVLGDIVNSSPIKGPSAGAGYDRLKTGVPGQSTYTAFRSTSTTALDNMRNTLFVGANDGMFHAFNTTTGEERFAYVPNSVYSVPRSLTGTELKLQMLSDPGYTHRFTVDGPPQIADAYIAPTVGTGWKTVLVSSTGAGSRGVFAMDVTDPQVSGTTGFGKTNFLWEFSEADSTDMGYVISYPHIARMRNGTWVAIFGNGYDSTNGQAKLFIIDLTTGAVVWQPAVGTPGGNGLGQPNFAVNSNREVTAIYAGDLKGNIWKFDVNDTDTTKWNVAFKSTPLYTTPDGANQPVSVMPELTYHPSGGVMVSFGTGKIYESEDITGTVSSTPPNVNLNTQAIYGIWDKPSETAGFSGTGSLVLQSTNTSLAVAADTSLSGTSANTIDWTTKRGWYMNLNPGGERVNVNPEQINSVLLVVTNKPDVSNPCSAGGTSRLFALDPITGSAPSFAVFDANKVGGITSGDAGYNVRSFTFGVLSLPTLQSKTASTDTVTSEAAGSRGQTGARLGGVEDKPTTPTDCLKYLLAGASNTSVAGFDIATCKKGNPRISWRQLK
jgi:type IV pilus assembly protein PilY1